MSANLLLKLSENLQMIHSTNYLHLPYQPHQEPIDYLLQTFAAPKKWKINLNYEPSESTPEKQHKFTFENLSEMSPKGGEPHLHRLIKESAQKIYCLKIPIKYNISVKAVGSSSSTQNSNQLNSQYQPEFIKHSYSLGFMLRFDDNLINFAKSYGLANSYKNNFESYAHLFSVNLDSEISSFEIWLSPNGNLLFM